MDITIAPLPPVSVCGIQPVLLEGQRIGVGGVKFHDGGAAAGRAAGAGGKHIGSAEDGLEGVGPWHAMEGDIVIPARQHHIVLGIDLLAGQRALDISVDVGAPTVLVGRAVEADGAAVLEHVAVIHKPVGLDIADQLPLGSSGLLEPAGIPVDQVVHLGDGTGAVLLAGGQPSQGRRVGGGRHIGQCAHLSELAAGIGLGHGPCTGDHELDGVVRRPAITVGRSFVAGLVHADDHNDVVLPGLQIVKTDGIASGVGKGEVVGLEARRRRVGDGVGVGD